MDFGFGEDHDLLRSTTRRFLDAHQSVADVRRSIEEHDVVDLELWRQGAALGWTAMLVPPEFEGGSVTEQPLVDLVVLAEELGRALNPGPFVPCNAVADVIARFGTAEQSKEHLSRIARGDETAAWCLSGDGSPDPGAVEVRAMRHGGGWRLDGVARYVHAAHNAGLLLVVAADAEGELHNFLVTNSATGLTTRTLAGMDLTRRFDEVRFDGVGVTGEDEVPGGQAVVERCLAVSTVLQSAESVGAAEALFDETVEYAKRRVQFGRTIGSFQAIKHRLADLHVTLEAMRVASEYAALALGDGLEDAAEAVATAGGYVDDAFAWLCGEAIQLHGGIGFTWEHDAHLFARRAKVNQVQYGDGGWHRERLLALTEGAIDGDGA